VNATGQPPDLAPPPAGAAVEHAHLHARAMGGANWFFWIAALSVLNSLSALSGSEWGLGATQLIDALVGALSRGSGAAKLVAPVVDLFVAAPFALLGVFARRLRLWAFYLGIALYSLDALLSFAVRDVMGIAVHLFALVWIYLGVRAARQLTCLAARPSR
jgi:hypothetical protein